MGRDICLKVISQDLMVVKFVISKVSEELIALLTAGPLRIKRWTLRSDYMPEISPRTFYIWGSCRAQNYVVLETPHRYFKELLEVVEILKNWESIEEEFFKKNRMITTGA